MRKKGWHALIRVWDALSGVIPWNGSTRPYQGVPPKVSQFEEVASPVDPSEPRPQEAGCTRTRFLTDAAPIAGERNVPE
jgi:hypothetical protein